MTDPVVVVIGAGAAGIGAGLELRSRGIPFVILEAANRVGGRAFTDTTSMPRPWDQGAHWLHCADVNPLVEWADRLGADYLRGGEHAAFGSWANRGWRTDAEAAAEDDAIGAAFAAVYAAAREGRDVPITEVIQTGTPYDGAVRCILQLMASEDPERVSCLGYADYADTEVNWPVQSGYGDLVRRMSASLPIRLGVAVTRIDQTADGVTIETSDGTLAAQRAIVTVSTNVLGSGDITFGSGPAQGVLERIGDVPCGIYEKVAISLRRRIESDADRRFCLIATQADGTPIDFLIYPSEPPVMLAQFAGDLARNGTAEGPEGLAAQALDALVHAYGADIRREVLATAATSWQSNPLIRGAYSYVRPGTARNRHAMISEETGSIVFAGEAFSRQWQATVHGAYQTGRDAVTKLSEGLVFD